MQNFRTCLLVAMLPLVGCVSVPGPRAVAPLQPTAGNAVSGRVEFEQAGSRFIFGGEGGGLPTPSRVRVSGEVRGLKPHAEHGFHVHDRGDCSAPDANSAGGHFNPGSTPHGQHASGTQHAGDLQSLKADANGVARFSFESNRLSVGSGDTDVIGRGLIVHRDADDFTTQPTGNSGPRLACAVIVRA